MSIGAGSLSLSRVQVLVRAGELSHKAIIAKLKDHAIAPIAVDDMTEESMGWCHPFTGEPHFDDASDWLVGDCLIFGLRCDTKKVPGTLYRLQLRQLMTALDQDRDRGRLGSSSGPDSSGKGSSSRRLRERAKERVKQELLKRTLPSIRLTEVVWNLSTHEVWLTGASSAVYQAFDACFVRTFGLPYVFRTPGTWAIDFGALLDGLAGSERTLESLIQAVPWGAFGVDAFRGDSGFDQQDASAFQGKRAGAVSHLRPVPAVMDGRDERSDDEEAPF